MNKAFAGLLVVPLLLSGIAVKDKATTDGGIDKYAKLTRGTEKAYLEMKMDVALEQEKMRMTGEVKFWLDTKRGLYRLSATAQVVEEGKTQTMEAQILFSPEGQVVWNLVDGVAGEPRRDRRQKTVPGKCKLLSDMGPLVAFVDAAFGYERISKEVVLKRAEPPLKEKDKLHWFEVTPDPEVKKSDLFKLLCTEEDFTKVWLAFSPETGWPMKYVLRGEDAEVVIRVTKVDLKANLKGVFELPAEVKEKLEDEADEAQEEVEEEAAE